MTKKSRVDKNNLMQYIQPQDLKSYGLIPEMIGRLPVLCALDPLDREALRKILFEPKNSIVKQYTKLLEMDGIKLSFDDSALELIVDKALECKLGARGLRSIMESIMTNAMFTLPSSAKRTFVVTEKYAREHLKSVIL